jgi:serine/threonine-protein kinase HipA
MWVLGQDLAGAVTVESADGEALPSNLHQGIEGETNIEAPMRFSLAGVQLKFSAMQNANGGLTIPATGQGGAWIVKLPSSRFDGVPENEYAMMELARMLGMDVPETQLLPINQIANIPVGIGQFGQSVKDTYAFVIKRFDRVAGQAVHIEDFAQVFGVYPEDKYKKASMRNIAQVIGIEGQNDDVARTVGVRDCQATVAGFYEVWTREKAHLPLTKSMVDAIDMHLRRVPLR